MLCRPGFHASRHVVGMAGEKQVISSRIRYTPGGASRAGVCYADRGFAYDRSYKNSTNTNYFSANKKNVKRPILDRGGIRFEVRLGVGLRVVR